MGTNERKKKKVKSKKRSNLQLSENDEMINTVEEETEKNLPSEKKKRKREKGNAVDVSSAVQIKIEGCADNSIEEIGVKKRNKAKKIPKSGNALIDKFGQLGAEDEDGVNKLNGNSKKAKKKKKKDHDSLKQDEDLTEKSREADQNEVYFISSGDDDCSIGMKKWVTQYHQSRPGLKVLQQRIDEFITAHEAKLEQERKEREALAAEGGWTVVVHHKGRKKTTDSESGITVGSVAQAAVEDKLGKKKKKEVGLDFYRFQRREAQRNEIMMLQSKFEQDRKRIQQLRAARKFRPY